MWLLCTELLCYDDKKIPSAAREKNIPRDAHSFQVRKQKNSLWELLFHDLSNTLFRPRPIRYVPLLSQRNLLVFLQHTDTDSVYFSLPFCKPESLLLSSCPWLNQTVFESFFLNILIFPLFCTSLCTFFFFYSMHSKFKERQREYTGQRRACGRLGYVFINELVSLCRSYMSEISIFCM